MFPIFSSQGGTPLPCLETFIGDSAFSEVSVTLREKPSLIFIYSRSYLSLIQFSFQAESKAVRNVVLANRHRIVSYLSYHSFGQKIMYPWSYSDEKVKLNFDEKIKVFILSLYLYCL